MVLEAKEDSPATAKKERLACSIANRAGGQEVTGETPAVADKAGRVEAEEMEPISLISVSPMVSIN